MAHLTCVQQSTCTQLIFSAYEAIEYSTISTHQPYYSDIKIKLDFVS